MYLQNGIYYTDHGEEIVSPIYRNEEGKINYFVIEEILCGNGYVVIAEVDGYPPCQCFNEILCNFTDANDIAQKMSKDII